jgi:hypothetical protein
MADFVRTMEQFFEDNLTDEDIAAWHEGELSEHAEALLEQVREMGVDAIQVWGSRTGMEPLSVNVTVDMDRHIAYVLSNYADLSEEMDIDIVNAVFEEVEAEQLCGFERGNGHRHL